MTPPLFTVILNIRPDIEFSYYKLKLSRKEKRAIEEFEKRTGGEGGKTEGVRTLKNWLNLKRETDKNNQVSFILYQTVVVAGRKAAEKKQGEAKRAKGVGTRTS